MSSGQNTWMLGAALAVVLLAGGGLFLAGVFDGSGTNGDDYAPVDVPDLPKAGGPDRPETVSGGSEGPIKPIPTSTFDPALDEDPELAAASGRVPVLRGRVEDQGGRRLAEAQVRLVRDVGAIKARAQEGEVIAEVSTGPDGLFGFEGLEPGERYVLIASHPDHCTERCYPIEIETPATLRQLVRLGTGPSISGLVRDASGASLADVEIEVFDLSVQQMDPTANPERSARSGADGTYRVSNLQPGMKKVLARAGSFATEGRSAIDVQSDLEGIDFVLNDGSSISGTVTDRDTRLPVVGAVVLARPVRTFIRPRTPDVRAPVREGGDERRDDEAGSRERLRERKEKQTPQRPTPMPRVDNSRAFLIEAARSDEEGRFTIDGLCGGTYMLTTRVHGYDVNIQRQVTSGTDGVNLVLVPSARIVGMVVDNETGEPVTRFSIAASPNPEGNFISAQVRQRFEDEGGRFEYVVTRPGEHYLIAEIPGYAGGRTEKLKVTAGQRLEDVVIRAVRGATVMGRLTDNSGAPVVKARVELHGGDMTAEANPFTALLQNQMRRNSRWGFSNAKGEWRIPNVLSGKYRVVATHRDYSEGKSADFECGDEGEVRVDDLPLIRGAVIIGRVLDKEGAPDPSATVMIRSEPPGLGGYSRSFPTDAAGGFAARGLKPGSYSIAVTQRKGTYDFAALFGKPTEPPRIETLQEAQKLELDLKEQAGR